MLRLIAGELRHRQGRALALLLGILVATTSFTVLTSASDSERLEVRGTVAARFRTAYDILVRPQRSATSLETSEGLVQRNFLSGIFGGITTADYRTVRRIPGVEVAAPIAMVGYVMPTIQVPVRLRPAPDDPTRLLYRVRTKWSADDGLTRIQDADSYVYVTRRRLQAPPNGVVPNPEPASYEVVGPGKKAPVCPLNSDPLFASPFSAGARSTISCWSTVSGFNGYGKDPAVPEWRLDRLGAMVPWAFPFVVAAIDPEQEAKLSGIGRAVVTGRYLREDDVPRDAGRVGRLARLAAPVLVSTTPYMAETAQVTVSRLPPGAAARVPSQRYPVALRRWLRRQPAGPVVTRKTITTRDAYGQLLGALRSRLEVDGYWTAGAVGYQRLGRRRLKPRPVTNPPDVWTSAYTGTGYVTTPLTAGDTGFRRLTQHAYNDDGDYPIPALRAVGTFDPAKLPGFTDPDAAPLSTYTPPFAVPGDDRARDALHGGTLVPSGNLAGYFTPPPLLLTSLRSLSLFTNPIYFSGVDAQASAPISVIRVRVNGVRGPDALSRERIRLVAERIARRTGLRVDITAGASPTPVSVELPVGRFGRPSLTLQEGWVKKGAAVAILSAVDRKSLVLFALILIVCALFTTNASAAAVRSRRTDLGVLACLGWPTRRLFAIVVLELGLIGFAAGVAGSALALPIGALLGLHVSAARAAIAIPAATTLAVLAALWPAVIAARSNPAVAVQPAITGAGRSHAARTIAGLALTNLVRVPGRSLLGAASLAIGVCALTLLLAVTIAFRGAVVGTLLGDAVAVQARSADFVAVAATLALGALAVADVLYLNVRDRAREFATLRATGWQERQLARLVTLEGVGMGSAGALVGAGLGLLGAVLFAGEITVAVVLVSAAAAAAGTAVAAAATLVPTALLRRLPTAELLAEE